MSGAGRRPETWKEKAAGLQPQQYVTIRGTGATLEVHGEDRLALLAWIDTHDVDLLKIWRVNTMPSSGP